MIPALGPVAPNQFFSGPISDASTTFSPLALGSAYGTGAAHENRQPNLVLNACIAWDGDYPDLNYRGTHACCAGFPERAALWGCPCRPGGACAFGPDHGSSFSAPSVPGGADRELDILNWPEAMRRDFCRTQFEARHLDYTSRYPKAWFLLLEQRREPAGRKPLSLHVQRGNDGAAALYRRLGFTLARPGATNDHFTWAAGESQGQPAAASHE